MLLKSNLSKNRLRLARELDSKHLPLWEINRTILVLVGSAINRFKEPLKELLHWLN
jgi:hypothetical protein